MLFKSQATGIRVSLNKLPQLIIAAMLALPCAAQAVTTILEDQYNVTGNGTGFALNTGVNSGINPPTTRLTGTARATLRYIHTTGKPESAYSITDNKLRVTSAANPGRFVLSRDGVASCDFAPVLGTGSATPQNPVVYELSIRMNNNSSGTQRCSFALATAEGDANNWDFGFQIYRTGSGQNYYTIGKRIHTGSSGVSNLNKAIKTLTPHTYGNDITITMRVTDAGAETSTYSSRVQLSLNGGNSWFYDTATDPDLPNGWRLDGPERHIIWDVAPNAGPVTYDAFSLKLDPPASNANTTSVFRAMAYNIHSGRGPDNKINTQRIANYIIEQKVDLVALNEVARNMPRSDGRDVLAELAEQTGMTLVFGNNDTSLTGNKGFGNAILSKFPVLSSQNIHLPRVGDNEQRGLLKAVVDVNGKFVSFWATHLDFKANDKERLMCGTNFNQWVAEETFPVVFGGDFNDTPNTPIYTLMAQKWDDIWPIAGDGTLGRTVPCPGPPFNARIDYIWRAKGASLAPSGAFVGYGLESSDHYPVLCDFTVMNFTQYSPRFLFEFDQGSGTKVSGSVAGLIGSFVGGTGWAADSPTGEPGDYSLYFNGSRRVSIVDTNQLIGTNGVNGDYTLQAWVKLPVDYAPEQRAILFQYERRPGFAMSITPNRTLHTTAFQQQNINSGAQIPNDGKWHHLAVVHTDGADMKFYIDAALVATVPYTNGVGFRTSSTITIGSAANGNNPFTGHLDRVSFENRALPPSQFDYPALPSLEVRRSGNLYIISWPAGRKGYVLEANTTLQPNGWVPVSTSIQDDEYRATITPTGDNRFFRLRKVP